MTALVKGSVAQGRAPPPPEAHVIKWERGSAVEVYGRSYLLFLRVSLKKALHLKPLNSCLPCFDACLER